ncbi:hypothetical protein [Streptomyces sp. bgisy153]|uniref:hypothetical protein n=1 Tax=Streptomyces sp. bgisy153 TaxID=3413793 RepID=UPI003D75CBF7
MSFTQFQDARGSARLTGTERPWLHNLLQEHAAGVLLDRPEPALTAAALYELLPADHELRHTPLHSGHQAHRWLQVYVRCLIDIFDDPIAEHRGRGIGPFTLVLNTAMELGGDALRLAARLHGQSELNCWVDGPHRAWLADVVANALADGLFRPDCGWESVQSLLRERDDMPVVVSFSDPFPTAWSSGFLDDTDDTDQAEQRWEALSAEERWQWGMDALHLRRKDQLEIRPDWADYRFGHELSFTDLLAEDRASRLEYALAAAPPRT